MRARIAKRIDAVEAAHRRRRAPTLYRSKAERDAMVAAPPMDHVDIAVAIAAIPRDAIYPQRRAAIEAFWRADT